MQVRDAWASKMSDAVIEKRRYFRNEYSVCSDLKETYKNFVSNGSFQHLLIVRNLE